MKELNSRIIRIIESNGFYIKCYKLDDSYCLAKLEYKSLYGVDWFFAVVFNGTIISLIQGLQDKYKHFDARDDTVSSKEVTYSGKLLEYANEFSELTKWKQSILNELVTQLIAVTE